jgi:hypothetical protein
MVHRPSIEGQNETLGTVEIGETLFLVERNEQDSLGKTMGCSCTFSKVWTFSHWADRGAAARGI